MKIFDATKLKRKNDTAILLGTGSSINDINKEIYKNFKGKIDIWGINNFFLHKFIIPDYLHFEIKADINGEIFPRVLNQKKEAYQNTIFIADIATRERDLPYKFLNLEVFKNFYSYNRMDRLNSDGSYDLSGEYKPHPNIVQIVNGKSNSKILDLMVRAGYKKIYFSGIDLNDCKYFWTDNSEYLDLNIPEAMEWCGKLRTLKGIPHPFEKNGDHPTRVIANFFKDFLYFNNIECYNLSKNSLLKDFFKTIKVDNIKM